MMPWGSIRKAIDLYYQSLAIAEDIGNRQGQSQSLGNIGFSYYCLGDYQQAYQFQSQHLAIAEEIQDPWETSNALCNLGATSIKLEQYGRGSGISRCCRCCCVRN